MSFTDVGKEIKIDKTDEKIGLIVFSVLLTFLRLYMEMINASFTQK